MTSPTERRPAAGFTIIEVLVVLVILGFAAGLVLSRGAPRSARLEVRAEAGQVVQALRAARGQAIATNREAAFVLDRSRRSYRVGAGPEHVLSAAVAMAPNPAGGSAGGPAGGLADRIVFAPDGSASGGQIALAMGTARATIAVDWLSGRISLTDGP